MDTPQRTELPLHLKLPSAPTPRRSPLPLSLRKANRAGPSNSGVSQLDVFAQPPQPSSPSPHSNAAKEFKTIMNKRRRATDDGSGSQPPNGSTAAQDADMSSLYSDSASLCSESPGAGPSSYSGEGGISTIGRKRAAGWLTLRSSRLKGSPTTSIKSLLPSPTQSMQDSVETIRPQVRKQSTQSTERKHGSILSLTTEGGSLSQQPTEAVMSKAPSSSEEDPQPSTRPLDTLPIPTPEPSSAARSAQSVAPIPTPAPSVNSAKSRWLESIRRGRKAATPPKDLPPVSALSRSPPQDSAVTSDAEVVMEVDAPLLDELPTPYEEVVGEASLPPATMVSSKETAIILPSSLECTNLLSKASETLVVESLPAAIAPSLTSAAPRNSETLPSSSGRGWFVSSIMPWGSGGGGNANAEGKERATTVDGDFASKSTPDPGNTLSSFPPSRIQPEELLNEARSESLTKKPSSESINLSASIQKLDSPILTSTLALNPASTRFALASNLPSWKTSKNDVQTVTSSGAPATIEARFSAVTTDPDDTGASPMTGFSPQNTSASKHEDPTAAPSSSSLAVNPIRPDHDLESDRAETVAGSSPSSTAAPASSWWNYIAGLGGGPTAFPPPVHVVRTPAPNDADRRLAAESIDALSVSSGGREEHLMKPDSDVGVDGRVTNGMEDTMAGTSSNDRASKIEVSILGVAPTPTIAEPAKAQSVASATSTAGWMDSIWGLAYRSAGVSAATPVHTLEGRGHDVNPEVKTEAEMVKEEALRDEPSILASTTESGSPLETPASPEAPESVARVASPNPVSIATPTRTWMSLFSSKNNLAMRRMTDGRDLPDEQHMEVMDVPDDVGSPTTASASATSSAPPEQSLSGSQLTIRAAPPTTKADSGRGRNGAPQNHDVGDKEKEKDPAPPLTNSNTVKKKVSINMRPPTPTKSGSSKSSSRTGSPAPSKTTGNAAKEKKERENFVLPTFGDTFYTLPRILPPPGLKKPVEASTTHISPPSQPPSLSRRTSTGITKKTFKFVSSLLSVTPPSKSKMKQEPEPEPAPAVPSPSAVEVEPNEDMLRYIEERRERVTRTWLGKSSGISSSASSTHSSSPTTYSPVAEPGSTLTLATGSGSAKSVRASSLLGVAMDTVPMGRIAHKGHHHIGAGSGQPSTHAAAVTAAQNVGKDLPRIWDTLGMNYGRLGTLAGTKRIVVIGIHGWFPGPMIRSMLGEPTGTSARLASMMGFTLEEYVLKHDIPVEKVTMIHLEGEGTIARRVAKLYQDLLDHPQWVADVHQADMIFIATHSQGSIVSTQLLASLIADGHIRTEHNREQVIKTARTCGSKIPSHRTEPYINYFETAAAKELFEFQDTASEVSQKYVKSLGVALDNGVKFVYIASLDDQVVPIYSGTFMTASHPLILRSLYIDGDAYNASDFLSNLIVLLLRIRNAGLDDGGLITHLSEGTAGSLSGVGHSNPYLNQGCYELAVRFMFETTGVVGNERPELRLDPFQARATRNDYEIPWALRGVITDPAVLSLFASEIAELRQAFDDWAPKTTILRDLRRKLEPIQSLRPSLPKKQKKILQVLRTAAGYEAADLLQVGMG
ncbi:hypothetical protein FRB98_006798 [Tulasnella sp. 332]|nr:hypothetical protein FRB98_006798 [Tulasnella sp. 332]